MDSLIFELQIVFYFQLFLSVNVRHTSVSFISQSVEKSHNFIHNFKNHFVI